MSKKALKVDDILDSIVEDDRILDALTARLTVTLAPSIDATIEASFEKLAVKFTSKLESLVEAMVEKFASDHLSKNYGALQQNISTLETQNSQLKSQFEESEKSSRLSNLVIHGLPESSPASTSESTSKPTFTQYHQAAIRDALEFFTTRLQVPVAEIDISFAHRIPNKNKGAPRPLIIGFVGRRVRDTVFAARKILWHSSSSKSSSIYINEHLTRSNSVIFARARRLLKDKKIYSTWTSGGTVLLKLSDSPNEKPTKIISLQQLDDLLPLD